MTPDLTQLPAIAVLYGIFWFVAASTDFCYLDRRNISMYSRKNVSSTLQVGLLPVNTTKTSFWSIVI
jgi:hypothetical protein